MTNLAVPSPGTWVAGIDATAAFCNTNIRDASMFLLKPPFCTMHQSAAQSIPNAAWTSITWDVNDADTYTGHSTVTNPSRYVAQVTGWYEVSTLVAFTNTGATTENRGVRLWVNGTFMPSNALIYQPTANNDNTCIGFTKTCFLNTGDYVETQALHNHGSAINTFTSSNTSSCDIRWARAA